MSEVQKKPGMSRIGFLNTKESENRIVGFFTNCSDNGLLKSEVQNNKKNEGRTCRKQP